MDGVDVMIESWPIPVRIEYLPHLLVESEAARPSHYHETLKVGSLLAWEGPLSSYLKLMRQQLPSNLLFAMDILFESKQISFPALRG